MVGHTYPVWTHAFELFFRIMQSHACFLEDSDSNESASRIPRMRIVQQRSTAAQWRDGSFAGSTRSLIWRTLLGKSQGIQSLLLPRSAAP